MLTNGSSITNSNLPVDQGWSSGTGSAGSRKTGSAGLKSADDILGGAVDGWEGGGLLSKVNNSMDVPTSFLILV